MVSRSSDPHGPSKALTNSEDRLGKIVSSKSLPASYLCVTSASGRKNYSLSWREGAGVRGFLLILSFLPLRPMRTCAKSVKIARIAGTLSRVLPRTFTHVRAPPHR